MLNHIKAIYPDSNLLVLEHYLKTYNCKDVLDYINKILSLDISIPEWISNSNKSMLELTQLDVAYLVAKSISCSYNNQYDCIVIYDKLVDPKKPTHMSDIDFYKYLASNNVLDPDEMFLLSVEKIHILFNYFRCLMQIGLDNLTKKIKLTRITSDTNYITSDLLIDKSISNVNFINGFIKNSDSIKVDFANKNIGGGVLAHGCCQEEILFLSNTELIGLMSLVDTLGPTDALTVSGITQYSLIKSYGFDLKFEPYLYALDQLQTIIMIDAIDYRKIKSNSFEISELYKATNGFSLIESNGFSLIESNIISTGNWGAGIFKGDPIVKFLIQLLAASITGNNLNYYLTDTYLINKLSCYYNDIKNKSVDNLYQEIINYKDKSNFINSL